VIKKVEYELNYRIKGKKGTKKIEIDFVPNQRHEDYSKLNAEMINVRLRWNNIQILEEEVKVLNETRPRPRKPLAVFIKLLKPDSVFFNDWSTPVVSPSIFHTSLPISYDAIYYLLVKNLKRFSLCFPYPLFDCFGKLCDLYGIVSSRYIHFKPVFFFCDRSIIFIQRNN